MLSQLPVVVGFCIFGYLSGSLPFSLMVTRLLKGVDLRTAGSGHATATNTMRQAGWAAGFLVMLLDSTKGFIPTFLALHFGGNSPWVVPLTACLAVIGHCWPVFAGFRGGMGLGTASGSLLAVSPLSLAVFLGLLIALLLTLHHAARAAALSGLLIAPLLWLLGLRDAFLLAGLIGVVIAFRFFSDWDRQYKELWLDRE